MLLSEVQFGYQPQTPVIRWVSERLPEGGLCALIGPNAAGKSTLLRLMLGQLEPQSGQITLDRRPMRKMNPEERAGRIAYVPQRSGADVAFTVEEVVALGRFACGPDEQAVERALQWCDLALIRRRVFSQLSAGQQQRVTLARALAQIGLSGAMRGRYLLLDEPVSAMDLRHVHHTMNLLRDLSGHGLGILIVLHDLNLASAYADTIWLMEEGLLRASGRWDQVLLPSILEPVYQMKLGSHHVNADGRPVFFVAQSHTLEASLPR